MCTNKDEYREYLEELSYEDLLGEDFLEAEAEEEIEGRLDAIRADLESLPYEELLDHDYLEALAQEEIDHRLQAFDDEGNDE